MNWLKRNLWMTLTGLVAVALIGFGGYYLWTQMELNDSINKDLEQTKTDLGDLGKLPIQPTVQNLEMVKKELAKAKSYVTEARKNFPSPQTPAVINQTYKSLLETTIAELRKEALLAGTKLPTNYNFSFEAEIGPVNFEPASFKPLTEQLAEIATISSNLFRARIDHLDMIRRVAVSKYDSSTSSDILAQSYSVNKETEMALWPYEFRFSCFSPALAAALQNISHAPSGMILKSVAVEPMPPPPAARGVVWSTNSSSNKLTTVLDEKLLRVTLVVNVIKPAPATPATPRGP